MSVVRNAVRHAAYFDSIVLMRVSREIASSPGVEEAGLFIGTPANKEILQDAGILGPEGAAAGPGDLVIAVRASGPDAAEAAIAQAERLLDRPAVFSTAAQVGTTRSIRAAIQTLPHANLALISIPGHFVAAEARKAMALGLNVMIFSDNVAIEDEVALKQTARERGIMVMGPDCGTAIIAGTPLGFANVVPRGDIGIVGASGTGIQEVSCLIARAGRGVSHAIGTGGRDLKSEVGAITTLMAIDALDADPATRHVVLISKPPAADAARLVLDRVARSPKTFTICFIGAFRQAATAEYRLPANARAASTLRAAAALAVGHTPAVPPELPDAGWRRSNRGRIVRGLFVGGTLCAEAQVVFLDAGLRVSSNVPVPGATAVDPDDPTHQMIDLGDDAFTRGRPHPMIDPAVRAAHLAAALDDPATAVVLLDLVLGYGAHPDPAGHVLEVLAGRDAGQGAPLVIASVIGTDADPQSRATQAGRLMDAGVIVAESNADAALAAMSQGSADARVNPVAAARF